MTRRRSTLWPRGSSDRPGHQLGSRLLPSLTPHSSLGTRGALHNSRGAVGQDSPRPGLGGGRVTTWWGSLREPMEQRGVRRTRAGPTPHWSHSGTGAGRAQLLARLCQPRWWFPGAEQVSEGTGLTLRGSWEGAMQRLEPHHLECVSSQYRSIYSLEIKDLRSTGHFVLPGGVGREGVVWALFSLSFPAWGLLHMTGQTPGFLHLSCSSWSPSALFRVPSTPVGRGKKMCRALFWGG